jgi:4-carboxymuconolactone decarboxylase
VATHWDSAFERYAHEAVGLAAGLSEEEINALRELPRLQPADPQEAAALNFVRDLLVAGDPGDDAWASARAALGEAEIFECR